MAKALSDEEFARGLLEAYLRQHVTNAHCELVATDPPDLTCHIADEQWAVEVTRVNQLELYEGSVRARDELDKPLMRFGQELGECTKLERTRNYSLFLKGPATSAQWRAWKHQVRKVVKDFVSTDSCGQRCFNGGWITAHENGSKWQVAILPRDAVVTPDRIPAYDIAGNIEAMLKHALSEKAKRLSAVSEYDKTGLVFLNTYFFGDDLDHVTETLERIIREDESLNMFDFVFYVSEQGIHLAFDRHPGAVLPHVSQAPTEES